MASRQLRIEEQNIFNNFIFVQDKQELISLARDGHIQKFSSSGQSLGQSKNTYLSNDRHQNIAFLEDRQNNKYIICQDEKYNIRLIRYVDLEDVANPIENDTYNHVLDTTSNTAVVSLNANGNVQVWKRGDDGLYTRKYLSTIKSYYSQDAYKPLAVIGEDIIVTQDDDSHNNFILHYWQSSVQKKISSSINPNVYCIQPFPTAGLNFVVAYDDKTIMKYSVDEKQNRIAETIVSRDGNNGNGWKSLSISSKGHIAFSENTDRQVMHIQYNNVDVKTIRCPTLLHFIGWISDDSILVSRSKEDVYVMDNVLASP
ncbi:unnamed protein product [Adineta ricciae]|uniref:Uncharacterized protein n=1 Tax=Adineta ricciae TaxID=249248 RepID=A0A815UT59_ADIRI|nr:unnamed protein product [Adineta ricciae]CAF1525040.1 unnamed protein product [Adineta ricciae]